MFAVIDRLTCPSHLQLVAALLLHEWVHAFVAASAAFAMLSAGMVDSATCRASVTAALSYANLQGNIPAASWLRFLLFPLPQPLPFAPHVIWRPPASAPRSARRLAAKAARLAAPAFSIGLALAATAFLLSSASRAPLPPAAAAASHAAACAFWVVAAAAVASDLLPSGRRKGPPAGEHCTPHTPHL